MTRSPLARRLVLLLQEARRRNLAAAGEPPPVPAAEIGGTTRRRLLGTGAAALAAGPLLSAAAGAAEPRIVVVGAGIAGLNAAYQLKVRAGLRATVYEARDRIGGRMLSIKGAVEPGLVDDLGGSLVNTDHADLLGLIREFGLSLFDRRADARRRGLPDAAYLVGGEPFPEARLAPLLRPLAARIAADADLLDRDYDRLAPRFDAISVRDYLDRHRRLIPAPFVRRFVEQTARTELGCEPSQTGAIQLLFQLPTAEGRRVDLLSYSDEALVVEGGSARVTDALGRALRGQVRTGRALTGIRGDGPYALTFARTGGEEGPVEERVEADVVVLAIPFPTLRRVRLDLDLPPVLRRGIAELDLGLNEKVFAGFRGRPWRRRPEGFVTDLWPDDPDRFATIWDDTQRQPGAERAVLNYFLGGDQVRRAFGASEGAVARDLVGVVDRAYPGAGEAWTGHHLRTDWHRQPFTRGSYATFRPGQYVGFAALRYLEGADAQEVRAGDLHFAGEQVSDEYFGFMNGAAQTGRLAALSILRRLGRAA